MPQFDQFSYYTQVLWFLLLFFIFYFLFTYFFLPKICYNLKFRIKKINFNNNNKNIIDLEKIKILLNLNIFMEKFIKKLNFVFNKKKKINFLIIKTKKLLKTLKKKDLLKNINIHFLYLKKLY